LLLAVLAPAIGLCEDAMAILGKVGQTYRGSTSYHFEGTTVSETNSATAKSSSETEFVVAYTAPNRFRVEFRYPNAGNWIRVSDGRTLSRYRSITKELKQQAAGSDDLNILNGTLMVSFRDIDQGVKKATLLDSEPVSLGGQKLDCYVIELERDQPHLLPGTESLPEKLWIDKSRFIVLRRASGTKSIEQSADRETENIRTTTFSVARINEPVEDALFALNVGRKK
jgi:outer membrane lipoprotein-sorting protein